ncbi:hypothetical protein OsJ_14198 [Oryza sativa Japonica Group]|uniref:Uncharacterized protein n=2 Tax=Oryza sativa subsp. japonica TaxID=39947 RepID=A0A8J8XXJ3_ORYSJ|nr:hypothetical protein OsJ_14198 [Oryza sativa Japonica Group]CAJ14991.1 OSJNBb0018A10.20 [Oryza sativa Japonica Group]
MDGLAPVKARDGTRRPQARAEWTPSRPQQAARWTGGGQIGVAWRELGRALRGEGKLHDGGEIESWGDRHSRPGLDRLLRPFGELLTAAASSRIFSCQKLS